jgi:hypothetical protein
MRQRGADKAGIALAATLHDPTGALAAEIRRWLPALRRLYGDIAVATSPPTAASVVTLLAANGVHAGTPATNTRGPLYRLALRRALASSAACVHYLDFDRALHWVARAPRELAALLSLAHRHRALLVGRTVAAHRTHHRPLWATETEVNARFATRLGLRGRVDFLVPSFVLTRKVAARLLARSRARDAAIYGELAALLCGVETELGYIECCGLDWETPDRHSRAVRRVGLAAWRRRMDTPAEWTRRTALAAEFVHGFERALTRWPVETVQLARVPRDRLT